MDKCIGVIGAGTMGRGVAQRFAIYGYEVVLVDIKEEILNEAIKEIRQNLRVGNMFQAKYNVEEILGRIHTTLDYKDLQHMEYIVENTSEIMEIKEKVYEELEKVCKESCVYMVDTSCIPISSIGSLTMRPEQVIGVHFMNPVTMKNFAEVIRGKSTSDNTVNITREILKTVDIEIEVINDSAGFVSNRISHLYMNEAASLVHEGIARVEQIDNIFKKAFGHKMGPLETADLIGIDTVVNSLDILYKEYRDKKFQACQLLTKMVSKGELGRKSRKGFYSY